MTSAKFHRLFGGPPRQPESMLTQRDMDLAASIQNVCEDVMLKCARHLHELTGLENLALAGGVALNCVGNGELLRDGPFGNIWIQPAAGDAGGALGVALLIWHQFLAQPRVPAPAMRNRAPCSGRVTAARKSRARWIRPARNSSFSRMKTRLLDADGGFAGDREGGRLVSRANGIWAARTGRALDHWRRAQRDMQSDMN